MIRSKMTGMLNKVPTVKKGLKHVLKGVLLRKKIHSALRYQKWLKTVRPTASQLEQQRTIADSFTVRPLISVITPVFNTPEQYFREMIASVQAQTYSNWELVLIDDASPNASIRELIKEYAAADSRIVYTFLDKGLHIAGATNAGITMAKGDYISLFDHDDTLEPDALFEIVKAINAQPHLSLIYTDEDKYLDDLGVRADPFFKPSWNPDFLRSVNYITHFTTIKKTVLDTVGYEDPAFNGAQDWELFLRVLRAIPNEAVCHIPKVLYSWRVHAASTAQSLDAKPYVITAQQKAIEEDLAARKVGAYELSRDEQFSAQWRLTFAYQAAPTVQHIVVRQDGEVTITAEMLQRDVVVFHPEGHVVSNNSIQPSIGDVLRPDIGFVVPGIAAYSLADAHMKLLLESSIYQYVIAETGSLTAHYYRTARYNVPSITLGHTVVIETAKIKAVVGKHGQMKLSSLSEKLSHTGLRHLYNPYVKRYDR